MTKPKAPKRRAHTGAAGQAIDDAAKVMAGSWIELGAHPDGSPVDRLLRAAERDDATLGSTARALMPLLALGLMGLERDLAKIRAKRPKGRPSKSALANVDCWRAYQCWAVVQNLGDRSMSVPAAIALVRKVEDALGVPVRERCFPDTTSDTSLVESVSRGRGQLGITGLWTCAKCEEIRDAP